MAGELSGLSLLTVNRIGEDGFVSTNGVESRLKPTSQVLNIRGCRLEKDKHQVTGASNVTVRSEEVSVDEMSHHFYLFS